MAGRRRQGQRRRGRLVAATLGMLCLVGACGGTEHPQSAEGGVSETSEASTTAPIGDAMIHPGLTTVATTSRPTYDVYRSAESATPSHQVSAPEGPGVPLTFLVLDEKDGRLLVQLPERPNGSTGWIERGGVTLRTHDFHITVTLADFNITVWRGDEVILDAPVGVATDNTPSPGGVYYTTSLLEPPDPGSVYGTYAYGLSAFSEVLESFSGGPGQLAIHGTNDDATIGTRVSHGCIRMHNADIELLVPVLPLGVPVTIT